MMTIKLSKQKLIWVATRQAAQGKQFIIADHNKPMAVIGPAQKATRHTAQAGADGRRNHYTSQFGHADG